MNPQISIVDCDGPWVQIKYLSNSAEKRTMIINIARVDEIWLNDCARYYQWHLKEYSWCAQFKCGKQYREICGWPSQQQAFASLIPLFVRHRQWAIGSSTGNKPVQTLSADVNTDIWPWKKLYSGSSRLVNGERAR